MNIPNDFRKGVKPIKTVGELIEQLGRLPKDLALADPQGIMVTTETYGSGNPHETFDRDELSFYIAEYTTYETALKETT